MKYQGLELSKYKSDYLAQQMGMLTMVKRIFLVIFIAGAAIFFLGGLANGEWIICLLGPAFVALICGAPLLYTTKMVKAMQEELDRRNKKNSDKANTQQKADDAAKKQLILTVAFLIGFALLVLIITSV